MTGTIPFAVALSLSGTLLVHHAWRCGKKQPRARLSSLLAGWGLLAASLLPWSLAAGSDRGAAFALLAPVLTAFALLAVTGWREARRGRRRTEREKPANGNGSSGAPGLLPQRVWIFLLAGPLSALATFLLSAAFYYRLAADWDPANRLAAALLFAPLVWAALTVWSTYDDRLGRRGAVLGGLLLLGLAGVFPGTGGVA